LESVKDTTMKREEPFVSILTPFYNTAEYLAECIESVLHQDHGNFEYVLVDNWSTDRGGAVVQKYARLDSRIRLIRADRFRGQIENYNYAMQFASPASQYVKLAQADDRLYEHHLSRLVKIGEEHPEVGLIASYDVRGDEVFGRGLPVDREVFSGREAARAFFMNWVFPFGSPTTVLYRGDVVRARQPFFPDALHADTEAIFEILADHAFGFAHEVLSFTRVRDGSISGKRNALDDGLLDRLILVKRFGPKFLEPADYETCSQEAEAVYYRTLGRRWLKELPGAPDEEFWKFHRDGLATIGERIEWSRVAAAVGRIVTDNLLHPRHAVRAKEV
jgi:glycosyltransferase involved in cell wall biosynthesis